MAGTIHTLCAAFLVVAPVAVASAQIVTTEVAIPRGKTSVALAGTILGEQTRDYVVRAREGQTMRVTLSGAPIVFFNVLPPGSNDEAIFTGSTEGNSFSGTLNASGAYKIRVYQMRASARRGERGAYRLNVSVSGGSSGNAGGDGLSGLAGSSSIGAIDTMTTRGFRNVDSFESGTTQYGIFYNAATGVCAQLTMADGKVVDASDIKTHPKCR